MEQAQIKAKLNEFNLRRSELEEELKQCKTRRDRFREHSIKRELQVIANQVRHLLFKLDKYRYPEDDMVKGPGGEMMPANIYHWLKE